MIVAALVAAAVAVAFWTAAGAGSGAAQAGHLNPPTGVAGGPGKRLDGAGQLDGIGLRRRCDRAAGLLRREQFGRRLDLVAGLRVRPGLAPPGHAHEL